jgi:hypothetical protein
MDFLLRGNYIACWCAGWLRDGHHGPHLTRHPK